MIGSTRQTKFRVDRVRYSAKHRSILEVTIRRLKARMVQSVDEVVSQFQAEPLFEFNALRQGQVENRQAGAAQSVSAVRTESSGRLIVIGVGVKETETLRLHGPNVRVLHTE